MVSAIDRDELASWLRLSATEGVGNGTARRLLAAFGLPTAIFAQSRAALEQLLPPALAAALQHPPPDLDALLESTWRWLQHPDPDGVQRHVAALGDPLYPPALLELEDPPLLLHLMGRLDLLAESQGRALAVVGSRNPTPQGRDHAREFSRALAQSGLVIVSGLALGVDGAAHEGALAGAAPGCLATIAVVGTGLDRVYPARHRELAHRIAAHGVVMSEFPLGTPPLPANFPRRNRIISGLSLGTLVVEAVPQSGSLITARMAVEQGREVFAIPGSIHSPQSRGCHALIRQGAKLVESAQDVLEELRLPTAPSATTAAGMAEPEITTEAQREDQALLEHLGHEPTHLEALIARTGREASYLQARLLELELEGRVARLPGGLFQRLASA